MNTFLWICQALLALAFLGSGFLKSTMSKERMLASGQTGVGPYSIRFIRFIAACELFGVAGLVLPQATGIATVLTPLAAVGLGIIMIGAAVTHARLHEPRNVTTNLVLLVLCLVVAIGRLA
jgi:DoxX-like family